MEVFHSTAVCLGGARYESSRCASRSPCFNIDLDSTWSSDRLIRLAIVPFFVTSSNRRGVVFGVDVTPWSYNLGVVSCTEAL